MNPAQNLVGTVIKDRWIVDAKIDLQESESTGGFFSIPYSVHDKKTGQKAFLKILDVVKAISRYATVGLGVAETLNRLVSAHLFEANLMRACGESSCDRIVRALDFGEVHLQVPPFGDVGFPFLIFELADGDTYKLREVLKQFDAAWCFSTLHQVALGLKQLHAIEIAHQDLKASNVVFFGPDDAKLADLGRAVKKGVPSPNDDKVCAGAVAHAPPEKIYGYQAADWDERHTATDLYHLGSFAFMLFTNVSMTIAIMESLPRDLRPEPFAISNAYKGKFQDALPALEFAFGQVIEKFRSSVPESCREQFITVVTQLCHPDPRRRGHPADHAMAHGRPYSVERYISVFHRLAVSAQSGVKA
jgi:eukaryotic-like serine/threonine-protein kinase